jgi:hypothetical protein
LSELIILEELMTRLRPKLQQENADDIPRPCDVFDIICGTSTGGYSNLASII